MATAVAGAVIGINPFDQPDVEASKVAARELTDAYEKTGALAADKPVFKENGVALYTDERNAQALRQAGANSTLQSWLGAHFARIHDGDYFAILAYLERGDAQMQPLQELRTAVRDAKHVATCLQFGPRFLHSTGQAYKGGPNSGVFLQITADAADDVKIPGRKASFGVIEAAQARGDFRVLDRARPPRIARASWRATLMPDSPRSTRRRGRRCDEVRRMQLGIVGLGRMGGNIAQRLMRHGHSCVVYDKSAEAVASIRRQGRDRQPRPRRSGREASGAARGLADAARRQGNRRRGDAAAGRAAIRRHRDRRRQHFL